MKHGCKSGFTLIEVTFTLMLMSLGLFAIFHLFPSGLRASVDANAFTRQSMFAEDVFGTIRAVAAGDWRIFASEMERVSCVSTGDVVRVCEKYLNDGNLTVGWFVPGESSGEGGSDHE